MWSQATAGGVQDQQHAQLPADVGDPLVEVGRNARRQAAAGHHEFGWSRARPQLVEASCLFGEGQLRTGKHEPVLLTGCLLVDGEALPRRTR